MTLHSAGAPIVGALLLAFATACLIHPQSMNESPRREMPVLQNTCLISAHLRQLVKFYEPILNRKANWSGQDYAEFPDKRRRTGNFLPRSPGEVHPRFGQTGNKPQRHFGIQSHG